LVGILHAQTEASPAAIVVALITFLPYASIQHVSSGESDNERAYAFHLPDSRNRGPTITANIGGVDMSILVDSGATKTLSMRLHGNG
jgi:hypothetical protein